MANIDTELNFIKTAVYGKDVRSSIRDAIEKINDETEDIHEEVDTFIQGELDTSLTSEVLPAQGKAVGDVLQFGPFGAHSIYPQSIKGVTGVMQYCTSVLRHKKCVTQSGTNRIIDDDAENVYLFETGVGWIVGSVSGMHIVDKTNPLAPGTHVNTNVARSLTIIPSDKYYAVNESELHFLDLDYSADGMLGNSRELTDIPITNFSTSTYSSGITSYGGTIKAMAPFRFKGKVSTSNASRIIIFNLDGTYNRDVANGIVEVDDEIVIVVSNTPSTLKVVLEYDYVTLASLAEQVKDIQNGFIDTGSLDPTKIKNVDGVFKYLYKILHNKTIGIVSGALVIKDGTDDVYLFETGSGWIANDTTSMVILNKSTLTKSANGLNAKVAQNLKNIASDKLCAICKTGLHILDFDFVNDSKFPYTTKNLNELPDTLFGSSNFANGINHYNNGQYKAFAPFRYNGSIKVSGVSGYTIFNDDGTIYGSGSLSNGSITIPNKVIAIYSNTMATAKVEFPKTEYEFSDEQCSVFGDSLTADAAYYPYLAAITGMQIKNCGIGGTRVSGDGVNAFWRDTRINTLEGKFVIVLGGTNDCQYASVGERSLSNYDTDTFVGAYNVMLSKIYYRYRISAGYYTNVDYSGVTQISAATFPNIILITPPKLFGSSNAYDKSKEFGEYVKEIASWWGLPVVDAWSNMQMSWVNESYFFSSSDKTHYNTKGRSKLASLVAAKMNECYMNFNSQET